MVAYAYNSSEGSGRRGLRQEGAELGVGLKPNAASVDKFFKSVIRRPNSSHELGFVLVNCSLAHVHVQQIPHISREVTEVS